jgi:cob(I)alamin adenosyltransferase
MEAIGTVDEASAAIGIARSQALLAKNQSIMLSIQRDLYQLMTELATTAETAAQFHFIDENSVSHLEDEIGGSGA